MFRKATAICGHIGLSAYLIINATTAFMQISTFSFSVVVLLVFFGHAITD